MEIRELQCDDLASFLNFYNASFPEREDNALRFNSETRHPLLQGASVPHGVLALNNQEVIGQLLIQPCEYAWSGVTLKCYIGYDYYVHEKYRSVGLGGLLALDVIRRFCPYFTIGVSDMTKQILLALDMKVIGELDKYLWLRKSVKTALSIIRELIDVGPAHGTERPFPDSLSTPLGEFRQGIIPRLPPEVNSGEGEVLAFTRKADFVRWRFLEHPNHYSVFTVAEQESVFFAVRICYWRGLRLLSLVDYRYPLEQQRFMEQIINCAKQLAKAADADGIITMSSHCKVDKTLRQLGFIKIGKPTLIMAQSDCSPNQGRIAARKAVLATMADGDTDLLFKGAHS